MLFRLKSSRFHLFDINFNNICTTYTIKTIIKPHKILNITASNQLCLYLYICLLDWGFHKIEMENHHKIAQLSNINIQTLCYRMVFVQTHIFAIYIEFPLPLVPLFLLYKRFIYYHHNFFFCEMNVKIFRNAKAKEHELNKTKWNVVKVNVVQEDYNKWNENKNEKKHKFTDALVHDVHLSPWLMEFYN